MQSFLIILGKKKNGNNINWGIIACLRGWSAYNGITSSWLKYFKSTAFLSLHFKMIAAASEVSQCLEVHAGISGKHKRSIWRGHVCPFWKAII